VAIG
jgi:hypothetical protein